MSRSKRKVAFVAAAVVAVVVAAIVGGFTGVAVAVVLEEAGAVKHDYWLDSLNAGFIGMFAGAGAAAALTVGWFVRASLRAATSGPTPPRT